MKKKFIEKVNSGFNTYLVSFDLKKKEKKIEFCVVIENNRTNAVPEWLNHDHRCCVRRLIPGSDLNLGRPLPYSIQLANTQSHERARMHALTLSNNIVWGSHLKASNHRIDHV